MIRTLPTLTPSSLYARAATPVFYSADLDYWVVTRDHDIEQIFQTGMFSAANTVASLQPICPAAGRLLAEGGFRPVEDFAWSSAADEQLNERLGRLLGGG